MTPRQIAAKTITVSVAANPPAVEVNDNTQTTLCVGDNPCPGLDIDVPINDFDPDWSKNKARK